MIKFPEKIADAKIHSIYVYDNRKDYELDFIATLLLECGYTAKRQTLLESLDRNLHPDELVYIREYLATPRSLVALPRRSKETFQRNVSTSVCGNYWGSANYQGLYFDKIYAA